MEREFMQMSFPCYLLYSLLSLLGQFQELSDPIQIVKVQNGTKNVWPRYTQWGTELRSNRTC